MVGITSQIASRGGGSNGVGFAIPVNTAKRVVAELIQYGKVRRGWIDASLVQLFPALVSYAKLPVNRGLLVSRVRSGGLAQEAGLRQGSKPVQYRDSTFYIGGDIIVNVDGMKIETLSDLYSALEDNKPGDKVAVRVIRGKRTVNLTVTLGSREDSD
jgi:S1-C subfamily serine protease